MAGERQGHGMAGERHGQGMLCVNPPLQWLSILAIHVVTYGLQVIYFEAIIYQTT
jgi:hypothetical protein